MSGPWPVLLCPCGHIETYDEGMVGHARTHRAGEPGSHPDDAKWVRVVEQQSGTEGDDGSISVGGATRIACKRCGTHSSSVDPWRRLCKRCAPESPEHQPDEGELARLRMQVKNLTGYVADICDEANAVVPVSTLEAMGKMRDDLSAEAADLRRQLGLVPPALLAAALGKPHGDVPAEPDEDSKAFQAGVAAVVEVLREWKRSGDWQLGDPADFIESHFKAARDGTGGQG